MMITTSTKKKGGKKRSNSRYKASKSFVKLPKVLALRQVLLNFGRKPAPPIKRLWRTKPPIGVRWTKPYRVLQMRSTLPAPKLVHEVIPPEPVLLVSPKGKFDSSFGGGHSMGRVLRYVFGGSRFD